MLCAKLSNIGLDGGLGQCRGFQDALGVQGLPDLEHSPRRPNGVAGGVQPFVCCGGSFVSVPAIEHISARDVSLLAFIKDELPLGEKCDVMIWDLFPVEN